MLPSAIAWPERPARRVAPVFRLLPASLNKIFYHAHRRTEMPCARGIAVYAKLIVWRLGAEYRDPSGYERFLRGFAPDALPQLRPFGMLDGFIIRLTHSTVLTVNLYETADGAYSAWHTVVSQPEYGKAGDLEVLFHLICRGDDLPLAGEIFGTDSDGDSGAEDPADTGASDQPVSVER
ncbi:MAG TPA: hypothetical protein VFI12_01340 [Thermomicrobiales bacterium]|jgi:hypothetical protein|nr:hypothetical protein [Thermomicrobiales bacterium]